MHHHVLGRGVSVCAGVLAFCFAGAVPAPVHAQEQDSIADEVTARQGVGAFNSITDGQPVNPGQPEASVLATMQRGAAARLQLSVSLTPGRSRFLRNALFSLIGPTINAGEGAVDFEQSATAQWQQRWSVAHGAAPTVATVASLQVPFADSLQVDGILTGVLVWDAGAGALYLNGYLETHRGLTLDGAEVGAIAGWKAPVGNAFAAYADVLVQRLAGANTWTAELSAEIDLPFDLTLGPGVSLGLAAGSRPVPGAGLLVTRTW
ncbi:MAG: hypothetical protein FIB01_07540 [Gemmatimonadetes bacterium]|nr:hypothetical protein [Gemmatimonadota bacterium]